MPLDAPSPPPPARARRFAHRTGAIDLAVRPAIFGIVNVTPDSFSDGGAHDTAEAAIAHGLRLLAEGADVLDVGGESTRPGAAPVPFEEELRRVLPVVRGLAERGALVSIDTYKPEAARAAVAAGASIVNDVRGLRDAAMRAVVAESGAGAILMHMLGEPRTMQAAPQYADVVAEVAAYLAARAEEALAAGIPAAKLALDPGIGFGKTLAHNLALLRGLPSLVAQGFPVFVGLSRKSFLGALCGGRPPQERTAGGLAATLVAVQAGATLIRTHDVRATRDALAVWEALRSEA